MRSPALRQVPRSGILLAIAMLLALAPPVAAQDGLRVTILASETLASGTWYRVLVANDSLDAANGICLIRLTPGDPACSIVTADVGPGWTPNLPGPGAVHLLSRQPEDCLVPGTSLEFELTVAGAEACCFQAEFVDGYGGVAAALPFCLDRGDPPVTVAMRSCTAVTGGTRVAFLVENHAFDPEVCELIVRPLRPDLCGVGEPASPTGWTGFLFASGGARWIVEFLPYCIAPGITVGTFTVVIPDTDPGCCYELVFAGPGSETVLGSSCFLCPLPATPTTWGRLKTRFGGEAPR